MLNVSIVTYHVDTNELLRCLQSLTSKVVEHIFIIDNANEERIKRFCESLNNNRIIYIATTNKGYGAGHNIALRESITHHTKFHLVLNSDVYFHPDALSVCIEYMENNPSVGQMQPKITNPDGSLQHTVRLLPTPLDVFMRRFIPNGKQSERNKRYTLTFANHDKAFNVAYHQGSFMLLRTEILEQIGLFDERFFMYPEDIDLTRRIHAVALTMYAPVATIVHDHRAASYHSWRMTWIHIFNMCKYFCKWGWIFDSERKRINNELLKQLHYGK